MAPKRNAQRQDKASKKPRVNAPSISTRSVFQLLSGASSSQQGAQATQQATQSLFRTRANQPTCTEEPWTTKYAPRSRGDLAVNKKKVQEIEEWLLNILQAQGQSSLRPCNCCCLSGPPGCGKSTTIRMLAQEHGCELQEWSFPTPTLWSEQQHLGGFDTRYTSKMDAFRDLVDRAKLASLPLTSSASRNSSTTCSQSNLPHAPRNSALSTQSHPKTASSLSQQTACVDLSGDATTSQARSRSSGSGTATRTITLVSDFPHVNGPVARNELCELLELLVQTVQHPVIVMVTEAGQAGGSEDVMVGGRGQKRYRNVQHMVVDVLETAGAAHIRLNPLTARTCVKELKRIVRTENVTVAETTLTELVESVHADLFNAIQALRMHLLGKGVQKTAISGGKKAVKGKETGKEKGQTRDLGLTLFHALGKILNNKRFDKSGERLPAATLQNRSDAAAADASQTCEPSITGLAGAPAESPEEVVSRSGLDASAVTGFLSENYLDFIDADAVADAAAAAANFSDAVHMIRRQTELGPGTQWVDPDYSTHSPADAAAAALSCRGYMWANQHPAPSAWRPLRAPAALLAARAAAVNRAELVQRLMMAREQIEPAAESSVQLVPYARLLVAAIPAHSVRAALPMRWQRMWQGLVREEYGGGVEVERAPEGLPRAGADCSDEDVIEDV